MDLQYRLMLLAHILLLVFWLGTDLGVFVSARWVRKTGRPMSERWLLLQLGGLLDVMPRLCAALMFPLGATLARNRWGLDVTPTVLGVLWLVAFVWCGAILTAYRKQNTPIAEMIGKVQLAGLAVAGVGAGAWGLWLLSTESVPSPTRSPCARKRPSGAVPWPCPALLRGQCATAEVLRASRARSASSACTTWMQSVCSPSTPLRSTHSTGEQPGSVGSGMPRSRHPWANGPVPFSSSSDSAGDSAR